jgi:hypothetical protein
VSFCSIFFFPSSACFSLMTAGGPCRGLESIARRWRAREAQSFGAFRVQKKRSRRHGSRG